MKNLMLAIGLEALFSAYQPIAWGKGIILARDKFLALAIPVMVDPVGFLYLCAHSMVVPVVPAPPSQVHVQRGRLQ